MGDWNGFSRKHYMEEGQRHQKFYDVVYPTAEEAHKYCKKIARHFKIDITFHFTNLNHGRAYFEYFHRQISLPRKNIPLGYICHEIAHHVADQKYAKRCKHTKKFQKQCNKVCNWAKRYLPKETCHETI